MAITKTNLITAGDLNACANNLYNYLNGNAVPDYFDSVTISETTVSCIKGGKTILTFSYPGSYMSLKFTGLNSFDHRTVSAVECISTAYKCNNGFLLDGSNSSGTSNNCPIMLTKDNGGNVTIGMLEWLNGSSSQITCKKNATNLLYVLNEKTDFQTYNQVYFFDDAKCRQNYQTALVPLPVCGSAGGNYYTPNAFLMPFTQVAEIGKIDINGVKYLTNGLWCIKDE